MKQTNESKFRKTPWILTIFLILLLILFLAYIFFSNKESFIGTSKTDDLAKEESILRDEIALLEQDIYTAVTQCSANQECAAPAIEPTIPKPEPEPQQQIKPAETTPPTLKPKFNGSSIPATEYCPPDKIVRPKIIFVMDASPSMEWPVKANDEEISNLLTQEILLNKQIATAKGAQSLGLGQLGRFLPRNSPISLDLGHLTNKLNTTKKRIKKLYRESPKRMTLAKSVLKKVINTMPPDADMSMLMYKSCETILHYPGSTAAQKKQIINRINRVKPFPSGSGGSPIAASLSEAAKRVGGSSADNPSLIVMLTDGEESCRASPCAVARRIKQNQPWTAVHLVKLGSRSKASCIATSTGGKVYNPNSVDALTKAINEAQITAPFELKCNKD